MNPAAWPFGDFPSGGLESLGPHTLAFYADGHPYSNSAIVIGRDRVLVFDSNIFHYSSVLKSAMDDHSANRPAVVALSHAHADHVDGTMLFSPPAETWSTEWTRRRLKWWTGQDMTARNAEYEAQYPNARDWYGSFRLVVPAHGIEAETAIDLGGVRVRLIPEPPAHTASDLWAVVEPDGAVLCGDLWFNGCEPYLASGSLDGAITALDRLSVAGARTYLPGHGRAGRITAEDPMRRYIEWLLEQVATRARPAVALPDLQQQIAQAFTEQSTRRDGIRFPTRWPGFLEDSVEAAQLELAGRPYFRTVAIRIGLRITTACVRTVRAALPLPSPASRAALSGDCCRPG